MYPVFSPDGKTITFAGEYDGSRAVYVVQSSDGIPKCLTWNHQEQDRRVAWTRDGKRILFRADWSAKPPGAGAPGFPMFPA
jgi:tricorn protease